MAATVFSLTYYRDQISSLVNYASVEMGLVTK